MAKLESLVVDLQVETADLRKSLDEAKEKFSDLGKTAEAVGEGVAVFEVLKTGIEAVTKAAEFMERGIHDAAALGSGSARELGETLEHVGLATRQLGADLMSDLSPAFNALIEYFVGGVNWGKLFATVAQFIGDVFRALVQPIVAVAGALKGLVDGGNLESALKGAEEATAALAKHGSDFAGSLKTAVEQARIIAGMQQANAVTNINREGNRMQAQFDSLTGNRKMDRFAGATDGFGDFEDALNRWKENMKEAAALTAQAAVEDANGSKLRAEALRLEADQSTHAADAAKLAADGFRMMKEKLIVDTAEISKIKFGLAEGQKGRDFSTGIRTQEYNNAYVPTKGFQDFGDALKKQTDALNQQAEYLASAESIEKELGPAAEDWVLNMKAQASEAGRAAQTAGAAADAFFAVKDHLRNELIGAIQTFTEGLLSAMGDFGKVVNDAIKGFQQGGWIGAIAAVITDVLAKFERFAEITDISNQVLYDLINAMKPGLDALVNGLGVFMKSIDGLVSELGKTLNPVLHVLGVAFGHIGATISSLMDVLGPIIDMFSNVFSAFQSLFDVLEPMQYVIKLLGAVLKILGIAMLEVSNGLQTALGWVFGAIGDFVKAVVPNSGQTVSQLYALRDQMNNGALEAQRQVVDMWNGVIDTFDNFWDPTDNKDTDPVTDTIPDTTAKVSDFGDTVAKATTDVQKMTEQLTNVPTGFKVALARFNSTAAVGGDGNAKFNGPSVQVHVQGSVVTQNELATSIIKTIQQNSLVKTGVKWPK